MTEQQLCCTILTETRQPHVSGQSVATLSVFRSFGATPIGSFAHKNNSLLTNRGMMQCPSCMSQRNRKYMTKRDTRTFQLGWFAKKDKRQAERGSQSRHDANATTNASPRPAAKHPNGCAARLRAMKFPSDKIKSQIPAIERENSNKWRQVLRSTFRLRATRT